MTGFLCATLLLFTVLMDLHHEPNTDRNRLHERPNVILIIADQMRGDALSILDHPNVRTPNLDRMASQGVLFTHYYVAIEWGVDHQVGRLLDLLESEGLADDTIVLFTSEHGGFMGDFGMVRKGMYLYDALLHVPFIWYAPGRIQENLRTDALSQSIDLLPTLIDLTGGDPPARSGRSLAPILRGELGFDGQGVVFASAGYSLLTSDYFDHPERPYYDPAPEETRAFHTRVFDLLTASEHRTLMARTMEGHSEPCTTTE